MTSDHSQAGPIHVCLASRLRIHRTYHFLLRGFFFGGCSAASGGLVADVKFAFAAPPSTIFLINSSRSPPASLYITSHHRNHSSHSCRLPNSKLDFLHITPIVAPSRLSHLWTCVASRRVSSLQGYRYPAEPHIVCLGSPLLNFEGAATLLRARGLD